ncbi:hypothetical protein CPLU01_10542 [Colletotrichum plurivorum]|uniref:Uncharacterized protein n=1 Tax=Colletotrichum plurivorum TaxID=2175906 RepID=A0A8H6NA22_9PEZI|nr:hypothetical protein CPLU01_10542 [Colletotrichum plurivorum]
MCNNVSQDDVDRRETELRQTPQFLGNMHQHGSCIVCFDGSKRAAAHCIDLIARKANGGPPVVYKIQREMEIERRSLWDTSAANPLSTELKWQQTEATRELEDLRECEKREKDTQVAESFAHERRTLENKLLVANKSIKDLRVETKSIFDGREVECKERLKAAMQETRALEKELVDDENRRCRLQSFAGMGSKIASLQAAMKSKEKRLLAKRNIIPMLQVLGGLGCIISGATLGAPPFIVGGAALLGSGLGSLSRSLTEEKPKKREAAEKTMLAGKDGLGSHFN